MTLAGPSAENKVPLRQLLLPVLRFVVVSIVPPVLDTLVSFFCHSCSLTPAVDGVFD